MTCRICNKETRPLTEALHSREVAPFGGLCLGCFAASTDLQLFLIRATANEDGSGGSNAMGAWAEGWLREIIKDPTRYR